MTVSQMLEHVRDALSMAIGEKPVELRHSIASNAFGRLVFLHALWRWPKNLPTVPELDLRNASMVPITSFCEHRDALAKAIVTFAALPANQLTSHHPLLGKMRRDEWMRWGFLHIDHHLRQFGC